MLLRVFCTASACDYYRGQERGATFLLLHTAN